MIETDLKKYIRTLLLCRTEYSAIFYYSLVKQVESFLSKRMKPPTMAQKVSCSSVCLSRKMHFMVCSSSEGRRFFLLWRQVGLALSVLASIIVKELCWWRAMIQRSCVK